MFEETSSLRGFGVLAEDPSDCDALAVLIRRIRPPVAGAKYRIRTRPAYGCGNLREKGSARLAELVASGCDALIVVHDLDRAPLVGGLNNLGDLLLHLRKKLMNPSRTPLCICVPVEEIEAWFWSCQETLDLVTR